MSEEVVTEESVQTPEPAPAPEQGISQEVLNKVVTDRLNRQRGQYEKQISELEAAKAAELSQAAEAAELARQQASELQARLRVEAVKTAAVMNGVAPQAVEQVAKLVDLSDIENFDDSSVITEKVAAFISENPHFVNSQATRPTVPPVAANAAKTAETTITPETLDGLTPEQLAANPELFSQIIQARNNW